MRIPRIYEGVSSLSTNTTITLDEYGAGHVSRVLRLKSGDQIRLFDGNGHEFNAVLEQVGKKTTATILEPLEHYVESPLNIELLQVISRGDRMDFTIQKAVELGVTSIVPLLSERCGVKLDEQRGSKKLESYQKIAIAACEQCGRNVVPKIKPLQSLTDYLKEHQAKLKAFAPQNSTQPSLEQDSTPDSRAATTINSTADANDADTNNSKANDIAVNTAVNTATNASTGASTGAYTGTSTSALTLSCTKVAQETNTGSDLMHMLDPDGFINLTLDPRAEHKLTTLPNTGKYRILIGPEGGFTPDEVLATSQAQFVGITLGPRILRTETTALVALSILGSHFGDL